MKLAEALIKRAEYQTRLAQLKKRIVDNAKVQEGDKPAEDPLELLKEVEEIAENLVALIQKINKTNINTSFDKGSSITDAIAVRDVLKTRYGIYKDLAQNAIITQSRYTKSEVKFLSTVNVAEIQKKADDLAKEYRELDAQIQGLNWQTELEE